MKINKSKNKNFRKRSKTKITRKTKKTKRNIKKRKEKIIKNVMMGGSTARSTAFSGKTNVNDHYIIFRHMGKQGPNSFNKVLKVIGSELQKQECYDRGLEASEIAVIAPGNPENYYKGGSLFGLFRTKFGHHFAEDCRKMPLVSRGNMNVVGSTKGGKINMSGFQLALDEGLEREGWSTPDVGTVGLDYRYNNTRLFTGDARMVCNSLYPHCHNIINVSAPNARDDQHDNFLGDEGKKRYLELASSCLRHSLILAHCKGIKLVVCTFIGCGVYNQTKVGQICTVPEILFGLYEEAVKFCNLLTTLDPNFKINICFMGDSSEAEGFDVFKKGLSGKLEITTYNKTLREKILGKIKTLNSLIVDEYLNLTYRTPHFHNSELTKEQWEHIEYLYRGLNEGFVRGCISNGYSLNRLMILYGLERCCPAIKEDFKRKYSDWGGNLSDAIPQELSVEGSLEGRIFEAASVTIPKAKDLRQPVDVIYFYEKEGKREKDVFANLAMEDSYLDKPDILRFVKGNPLRHDEEYSTYYVDNRDPITKFEIIEGGEDDIINQYRLLKTLQQTAENYGCGHYVVKVYLGISRSPEKSGTTDATREEKFIILKHCDHLPLLVPSFNEPTTGDGAGVGGRGAGENIHAFAKVGYTYEADREYGHQFDCQHQMYLQDVLNNNYLSIDELRILTYELIYAVAFVHQCGVFIREGINPRTIMLTLVETGDQSNPTKSSVMITDFSYAIKKDGGDDRKNRLRDWKRVCAILEELKGCLFEPNDRIQFLDAIIKNLKGDWFNWGGVFVLGQIDGYTGSSGLMTAMNKFLRDESTPVALPVSISGGKSVTRVEDEEGWKKL